MFASCSSARTGLGTTDESCYLALPTAAKAVGGHGHLAGIRKYSIGGLKAMAPHLYDTLSDQVPRGQSLCVAGYTGVFTEGMVVKPLGRSTARWPWSWSRPRATRCSGRCSCPRSRCASSIRTRSSCGVGRRLFCHTLDPSGLRVEHGPSLAMGGT